MSTASITELLSSLGNTTHATHKTASAQAPPAQVNNAREELQSALAAATPAKLASERAESTNLEKIAQDLSRADHVAAIKEAQVYGAAMMDGLLLRANQYAQTAPPAQKVAAYRPQQQQQTFLKTAAEVQFEGAIDAMSHLGALAKSSYELGFDKMASLLASQRR